MDARASTRTWTRRIFFCLGAVLLIATSARADEEIRVRLDTVKSTSVTISGMGLRYPGGVDRRLHAFEAIRVFWKHLDRGLSEWTIEDRDTGTPLAHFKSRTLEVAGLSLRMNLRPIPGRLTLHPTGLHGTTADVITSIALEDYVRGVLPGEMPANWPLEALKAQAIAARTFALYRKGVRERMKATYHVETSVMDQVYLVPVLEDVDSEQKQKIDRAVRETRGMVLMTKGQAAQPLAAYFHADCGGRTEDARTVWGSGMSAGVAIDGGCPMSPHAKWSAEISTQELTRLLSGLAPKGARLAELETISRTDSGRVREMSLKWSDGSVSRVAGHDFRMLVGHERIRSTLFAVTRNADGAFEFSGQGFGHGVGMCQWGARALALSGQGYQKILAHYYPRANLVALRLALR